MVEELFAGGSIADSLRTEPGFFDRVRPVFDPALCAGNDPSLDVSFMDGIHARVLRPAIERMVVRLGRVPGSAAPDGRCGVQGTYMRVPNKDDRSTFSTHSCGLASQTAVGGMLSSRERAAATACLLPR